MTSLFPDLCTDDVAACRDFYVALLGLRVAFECDWYVQLQSPADPSLQLAFVLRDHESVPEAFRAPARGVLVTIECDDVDAVHARARALGLPIACPLRDEPWGQRHFMVTDPNGLAVDVVKPIPPAPGYWEAASGTQAAG